ncbi:hypothetical protein [Nocardia sp. NPDC046763]|uniref:hypothetical protein n=1 Tax=Nocardia sp. NPDC046763 TaxID=3155256 RepID=UPI0033D6CFC1
MSSPTPTTFASTDDVQNSWRTLNAQQLNFAGLLLQAAALWITGKCQAASIPVPATAAHIVSIEVVRAALQRDMLDGVPSGKTTRGDRSDEWTNVRTATLEELARTLVFSEYHLQLLGLFQPTGPRYLMGNRYSTPDPIIIPGIDQQDISY